MDKLTNAQMAPLIARVAQVALEYIECGIEETCDVAGAWPAQHYLLAAMNARRIRRYPERPDETKGLDWDDELLWLAEGVRSGSLPERADWMDDEQYNELVGLLSGEAEEVIDELCAVYIPSWDN